MRNGSAIWRHAETAKLTMRDFSDGFLDAYLAQAGDAVLQSVGCYQLAGLGVPLFSRIQGDFFPILVLPLLPLLSMLPNHPLVSARRRITSSHLPRGSAGRWLILT